MKFFSCPFKIMRNYLQTFGHINTPLITVIIFGCFLVESNIKIIASEKKDILTKEPIPLKRPYETMVDIAIYINNKQEEPEKAALQDQLFATTRACSGVGLQEEKLIYNQFAIIATIPIVSSLFSHTDPQSKLNDWIKLSEHIQKYIDIYVTDDKSFVVFIPKKYKADKKESGTWETEHLENKGFNNKTLKSLKLSEINPQDKLYKFLPNRALEIDTNKFESIFLPDRPKIARCIYLHGHGKFKSHIAGMNKTTYLKLLEILEKLNTHFLFISSCYAGGLNTIAMNFQLKEDFGDTLGIQKEKPFDILNIHFPIVVEATSDAVSSGKRLSLETDQIFFLNHFFTTLHTFLRSPTWKIGIKKGEMRKIMGKKLALKRLNELLSKKELFEEEKNELSNAIQLSKLWDRIDEFEKKITRSTKEDEELKELFEELSKLTIPVLHGPVALMSDVLKTIYSTKSRTENLPSIYIPDCQEIPGGVFFEAVHVDTMEIITKKNLKNNITITDHERIRIISKEGKIKEKELTREEKTKPTKYVLVYPVDMSNTSFNIASNQDPQFISKIGGNAYHIIKNFNNLKFPYFVWNFIFPIPFARSGIEMGDSHKAWLIEEARVVKLPAYDNVVLYKPAGMADHADKFDALMVNSCSNQYWISRLKIEFNKDTKAFSYHSKSEKISSTYYYWMVKTIIETCTPDARALEKFTSSQETLESIKVAADKFLAKAVPSLPSINKGDIELAQKILTAHESLPIEHQASYHILQELGKKNIDELKQVITLMNDKGKSTLLNHAIENADKDMIPILINDNTVKIQNKKGLPPLHYAIKKKADKETITLLIKSNNKSLLTPNQEGILPLHYTIKTNASLDIIKLLTNKEIADKNIVDQSIVTPDNNENCPLIYAIVNKLDQVIKHLIITNKKCLLTQDKRGNVPLALVILNKASLDIIKLLTNKEIADKNIVDQSIVTPNNDRKCPLNHAISLNLDQVINHLIITNDKCLVTKNALGAVPLSYAIVKNASLDIIKLLTNKEIADKNIVDQSIVTPDNNENCPLIYAISHNLDQVIKHLIITNDKCLLTKDASGNVPLHYAIKNKASLDIIKLLTNKKIADKNIVDQSIITPNNDRDYPLTDAILLKLDQVTKHLIITNDKCLLTKNASGNVPLHYAIKNKASLDIIKLLTNKEIADKNIVDQSIVTPDNDRDYPLIDAISLNLDQVIKHLITINDKCLLTKYLFGAVPLHYAVLEKADKNIIQLLINDKSLVTQNKDGESPLHTAILHHPDKNIIQLLINDKSLVTQDNNGNTPLHIAILLCSDKDIIQFLINEGSINAENNDKKTPLALAIENKRGQEIIDLLKKHGAIK